MREHVMQGPEGPDRLEGKAAVTVSHRRVLSKVVADWGGERYVGWAWFAKTPEQAARKALESFAWD